MFVLLGFAQVVDQLETKGRFRSFSFRTPEGYHFEGSLWVTEGLLEEPIEGGLFSFTGFCPSPGAVSLTAFRRADGVDPTTVPPTSSVIVGTITKVLDEDFDLEYMAYDKATRISSAVPHTVALRGNRWDKRKVVLRPGVQVQVLGTIDGPTSTDCDDFWIFSGKEPTPSPVKRSYPNVFAARPRQVKPLVLPSDDDEGFVTPGLPASAPGIFAFPPSRSSSPTLISPADEVAESPTLEKGKGSATKRPRFK